MEKYISSLIEKTPMSEQPYFQRLLNKKMNTFVRDEQMGDSFYYLGFLYTLTALAVSLFGIEDDINELLKNFGIAITTTLVGLIKTKSILINRFFIIIKMFFENKKKKFLMI